MNITLDFETRSKADLKRQGHFKYAEHESTHVLCAAVKVDEQPTLVWVPPDYRHLGDTEIDTEEFSDWMKEADIIEAHNVAFESEIWAKVMVPQWGFEHVPMHKWRCSAAKASAFALPRDLARACIAMGVPQKKDTKGKGLITRWCKPRNPLKKEKEENPNWENMDFWCEDPEDFVKLLAYCRQDVEAEHSFSNSLKDLSVRELEIFRLDMVINSRGINIDLEGVRALRDFIAVRETELKEELITLTEGRVKTGRQVTAMRIWLGFKRMWMPDLKKDTVERALRSKLYLIDLWAHPLCENVSGKKKKKKRLCGRFYLFAETLKEIKEKVDDIRGHIKDTERSSFDILEEAPIPPKAARCLEIRQLLSMASTAKLFTMENMAGADGRVRGTLMYHGASTGRWAGKGIQPQNYPRGSYPSDIVDWLAKKPSRYIVENILEDDIIQAASKCLRGMICAAPGNKLINADFRSIEARVLAWLAKEQVALQNFREGRDPYIVAATGIYHKQYEDITEAERQIGKVAVLALGFQGWSGAFQSMAENFGMLLAEEEVIEIVSAWREANPRIVKFWRGIEEAAVTAISIKGAVSYGPIKYIWAPMGVNSFLHCKLPSGKLISYKEPAVVEITDKWKRKRKAVSFMGIHTLNRKWCRLMTYGGKLTENIVQAVARELLAEAMIRVEKAGYPIVMHVHDEINAEVPIASDKNLEGMKALMTIVPEWAKGCPIDASGWEGKRYRK